MLLLRTFSLTRLLFLLCIILSIVGLALLWRSASRQERQQMLYLGKQLGNSSHRIRQQMLVGVQQIRWQRLTLPGRLAIVLPLLACISTLLYSTLNSPQTMVTLINTATSSQQWTHVVGDAVQALGTNGTYSVVETNQTGHLRQIEVLSQSGAILWHSFASEGSFSVSALPRTGSTLLVALHGPDTLPYQYAPADPAYPPALRDMLAFYQFDANTGQLLWSHIAAYPGFNQSMHILGADSTYIYIAGIPFSSSLMTPSSGTSAPLQPQLFAVNQRTGNVDWHIFGPLLTSSAASDAGYLLFGKRQVIWQIDGTVYAIDPLMGQIEWRYPFSQNHPVRNQYEEQQMVLTPNALFVPHGNSVYAFAPASGNLLWSLTNQSTHIALAVNDQMLLISSGDKLSAYALSDHHLLWEQQQMGIVQAVQTHATTAYVLSMNNAQIFVTAIQTQNGATRWTQTATANSILTPQGFLYHNDTLLVGLCQNANCTNAHLMLLQGNNGTVSWQRTTQQMSGVQWSQHATWLLFDAQNRPWPGL